tara:strand:+ start:189 stop:449 length:261 start_codon:yes stop_codon:yes gene_type:complete
MKVKIQQRSVYHKFAEVEIEIPNNIKTEDVDTYLWDNEHLYVDKIQTQLDNAELEFGFGLRDGMEDRSEESEWRYEIVDKNYGGHL